MIYASISQWLHLSTPSPSSVSLPLPSLTLKLPSNFCQAPTLRRHHEKVRCGEEGERGDNGKTGILKVLGVYQAKWVHKAITTQLKYIQQACFVF